jgi:hypothetical protein
VGKNSDTSGRGEARWYIGLGYCRYKQAGEESNPHQ